MRNKLLLAALAIVAGAACDRTISKFTVSGQPGLLVCKDAGPTSGTTDAPPVTIHVTPTCPKP